MDAESINRSITRLAHEILEHNNGPDNIILIGIITRGFRILTIFKINNAPPPNPNEAVIVDVTKLLKHRIKKLNKDKSPLFVNRLIRSDIN